VELRYLESQMYQGKKGNAMKYIYPEIGKYLMPQGIKMNI